MKKILILFLILGSVLIIVGAMFKILHYTSSNALLLTGILCNAVAFVAMAFGSKKAKV